MVRKSHNEKTVGPWAKQKLDALQAYLEAYMLVMKNTRFKLFYIDAFAGAGIMRVRDTASGSKKNPEDTLMPEEFTEEDKIELEKYIAGSPVRALGLRRHFDYYRFIDLDQKRVSDLEDLSKQYPDYDVKIYKDDANKIVQWIASLFTDNGWRGVAFLDPYGPHLTWATLEALANTRKFDVIINFPLGMAINRLITRSQTIPENWQVQLDLCFGCREWRDIAYTISSGLFGDVSYKRTDTAERLLEFYVRRLEKLFGHVSKPSLVRNTQGAPLYYIIWASSNERGKKIADHILSLGDKVTLKRG